MKTLGKMIIVGVCAIALLNIGTIRKKDDIILKTQTGPIAYKQKMEEIKEGEKGAPMPSMMLYPKWEFLSDPPYDDEKDEEGEEDKGIPQLGEPIPEDLSDLEEDKISMEDWWEIEEPKVKEPGKKE